MGAPSLDTINVFLYDWAADEDSKPKRIYKANRAFKVLSAELTSSAAVAAADTNFNTFTLQKATTAIATLANGPVSNGVAIGASTGAGGAMTLSTTAANILIADGDYLTLKSVKSGTGQAVADMSINIEIQYTD